MTEEQKDILILKMLDAPDSLTGKELDMILHDDELKDIYETSAVVSGACSTQKEFDVEQEWRLFRHKILPKPSLTKRYMRMAAIFIGVIVGGGLVGKMIDYTLTKGYEEKVAQTAKSTAPKGYVEREDTQKNADVKPTSMPNIANEGSTKAITTIPKQIKPLQSVAEEIDVDEYLRQQQEEIEDAIIRQNAEIYVDEYYAMQEFISGMNDENRIITE